ncbi:astacin [Teladorsagia circumcincta]|uniref:Astacin n=1 Tax=Teladorsagia circumcincta TaxID=45464 RepID=A0A2G9TRQ5_TELCI|nr:astacin [Teladorsagia circumcincta]
MENKHCMTVKYPGHNGDFGKYIPKTNDNFGLLYDYGSIMHYAAADYSTNGQLTLRPLDYNYVQTIGGPFIGFVDYYMMNFLYNCTGSSFYFNEKCSKICQPTNR